MTWIFKKTDITFANGHVVVGVRYVNDVNGESFDESYSTQTVSGIWPDDLITNRLSGLNAVDTTKIPLGMTLRTVTPPTVNPPTARDAYFTDLSILRQLHDIVDLGVITSSDKTYIDQLAKVQSEYQASYYTG